MSPQIERRTISDIRRVVRTGALTQPFRRNDVSKAIGRSLFAQVWSSTMAKFKTAGAHVARTSESDRQTTE